LNKEKENFKQFYHALENNIKELKVKVDELNNDNIRIKLENR